MRRWVAGDVRNPPFAAHAVRWLVLFAAVVAAASLFSRAALPSPYLLAAFAVGIAYALLARRSLLVPASAAGAAQGVIGVTAGSYLTRSTLSAVGAHLLPIAVVSVLTVALSVLAGVVLARFSHVDRPTAAFGMIAGGAAGIISLSREFRADARLVAVMQYVRVLIIVAVTPIVAIGLFGMRRATNGAAAGSLWNSHGALYVVVVVCAGWWVAHRLRVPGATILGPMILAAAVSVVHRPFVGPIPLVLADAALAVIGLDVGLRFTVATLRESAQMLPRSVVTILAMLVVSAFVGAGLAATAHVSMLSGYLATTPGGLTAVVALAVGGNTDTSFVVSVQVIRTFLMLVAAPAIARSLATNLADGALDERSG